MHKPAAILLVLLLASCAEVNRVAACEPDAIKAGLTAWLDAIENYELTSETAYRGAVSSAQIAGRVPDRLSIRLQTQQSGQTHAWLSVFDGRHQWVESRSGAGTEVFRIELAQLTDARRPFDTSYYIMGTGLLNGEDFPSTIRRLTSIYEVQVVCRGDDVQLEGRINAESFDRYAAERHSFGPRETAVRTFVKTFPFLTLHLQAQDHSVTGYTLGDRSGSGGFNVAFENIELNNDTAADVFRYAPPPGTDVIDITADLKQLRNE